jgi:hypothetical protein
MSMQLFIVFKDGTEHVQKAKAEGDARRIRITLFRKIYNVRQEHTSPQSGLHRAHEQKSHRGQVGFQEHKDLQDVHEEYCNDEEKEEDDNAGMISLVYME